MRSLALGSVVFIPSPHEHQVFLLAISFPICRKWKAATFFLAVVKALVKILESKKVGRPIEAALGERERGREKERERGSEPCFDARPK